jgi:diadenosine tetraphosphate (Ap4A) HIT family hydrolase
VSSCPFCAYAAGRFGAELLAYADEHVMVMPSKGQRPGNRGHCLVVPRAHVTNIYTLPDHLAAPVLSTVRAAARASKRAFGADGVTVRQNNEPAGGQDVFHLHFHVVPRFLGDDFDAARYETVEEAARIEQADALRRAWSA